LIQHRKEAPMADRMAAPLDAGDGWAVSAPEDEGLDAAALDGLEAQFTGWREANLHAALIARNGKLVYERYFAGEDWNFGQDLGTVAYHAGLRHDLRSITKSVVSLLVGAARERGWLGDLDAPVFDFFPEHADLRTAEKAAITLRHLLTMSAGLAWNEELPYSDPANSERRMIDAPDPHRYVLAQPLARSPGAAWNYNGGLTALLAGILVRAAGRPLDALAQEWLFAPLGIADVEWNRLPDGTPNAASGLRLRPRDLLRIGQLVLDGGIGAGRRIVAPGWIAESTTPRLGAFAGYFYGYHWWLGRSLVARRQILWASAVGWGGQRLFVVPACRMVVLVHCGLYGNPPLQPVPGEVVLRRYALTSAVPKEGWPAEPPIRPE
jgi:CubicO group peptidase (beta-lactamase class C family)